MSVQVSKRLFNTTEYQRMVEAGILSEDDRVELIDGEIIEMSPIGSHHQACVDRLNAFLSSNLGQSVIVRVQGPIQIDVYSQPQPDLALLRPRADFYAQAHPISADVLLIIEVADTSEEYDRNVKVPLYARAMIPEVWLVLLAKDVIEVYTQPYNGKYQVVRQMRRGESLTPESFPSLTLTVDAILG